VPVFAITVLKVAFLGLLYLFIFRAFRSVVVDLRPASPKPAPRAPRAARPAGGPPPTKVGVLDESGSEVAVVPLEGQVQIGRADACQIKSTDTFVSAFHARLFGKDGAWFVEDMGSTNGTFLNKERVTAPTEVKTGDRVMVGKTTLELRA
jgi:pSer/pThr/pTyr-binding forkhead associated (FHA) protein